VGHNLDYVIGVVEIGMLSNFFVTLSMGAIHGSDPFCGGNT
jgi:hypothetical protein